MMGVPLTVARLWANGSTVDIGGVVYVQVPIGTFGTPATGGNTCYNCVAYLGPMVSRLCDVLAPYCRLNHVFRRMDRRQ